ncbi:hypothetical protein KL867_09910 [Ruegeria litorea]|uniref:HNH endonuclease n=1 Tax=Falsiruegeria litorea TaxID=1280831 RepID=A0ABS5WQE5_9RHOB|nr:hypothetical protein [Falsiruegeria litorea]MBT3141367.1 hypothetical protein [Falsiruegeria litorea]
MGGYGSGRTGYKQKAENCRSLDVNQMHREGCLSEGWRGNWQWSRNGEVLSKIGMRAEQGRIVLDYRVRLAGGDWEPVTQPVKISHVGCNFGGQRPFYLCPGIVNGQHCGRRVGKLFSGGRFFLCRHCYSIAYASQSEERHDRLLRRANKLRMALGGQPGAANFIMVRPKGMWQQTYWRQRNDIEWCESLAGRIFLQKYSKLLSAEELEMFLSA